MNLDIKFELNKELDKQMAFVFINRPQKVGGIDFSKNVTNPHPEIEYIVNLAENDKRIAIDKYFDKYYSNNINDLENDILKFQTDWDKIESKFTIQINKIFKNPIKPDGKWVGYLSIINCNPRFLDSKTFQVFYKHRNGSNSVVIHEVLHFFFYEYAVQKFKNIFENLDKNTGIFWMLAELFNDVIQNLPEFADIQGNVEISGYPSHIKYQDYLKNLWTNEQDIDVWIPKAYDYLTEVLKNN
ncbi:MAG: hypothetical protein WCJ74_00080 [bacterium]